MVNSEETKISLLKKILAEQIGADVDDIHDDDALREDLHMSSSDLTDLVQALSNGGYNIQKLNLLEIETVADLIENLVHEDL